MIALFFIVELATSHGVPWAQITAAPAPGISAQSLERRDYDTASPALYGYTSVGMSGTKTKCNCTLSYRFKKLC